MLTWSQLTSRCQADMEVAKQNETQSVSKQSICLTFIIEKALRISCIKQKGTSATTRMSWPDDILQEEFLEKPWRVISGPVGH